MIAFKDFVPQQIRKQGFIKPPLWETVAQAAAAANEWIREQEVTVIISVNGSAPGLSQFVRVWYRAE